MQVRPEIQVLDCLPPDADRAHAAFDEGREAVAQVSPTVRQRELGIRLRELRRARGLTVEEVAERLLCSATKISRAETGARRPSLRDVRDLCQIYEVDAEAAAELMQLAREAREAGWWHQYDDFRTQFPFIGLEQEATAITCFSMYYVPALLQTAEYARAIITAIVPKISPEVLEERLDVRMKRQELLGKPAPPRYRAIIDEAALRRQVGGASVMRPQLQQILARIEEGRATVQVLPFSIGGYAAADSNFDYLEFGSRLPDMVYVEGLAKELYIEKESDVSRYAEALEHLRDAALNPRDSITEIQGIING